MINKKAPVVFKPTQTRERNELNYWLRITNFVK